MSRTVALQNGARLLAAWTLFGVMSSAHFFVREEAGSGGASFRRMLTTIVVFYWVWALLTPAAVAALRFVQRSGRRGWLFLLALAPVLVAAHAVIYLSFAGLLGADTSGSLSADTLGKHLFRHGSGGLATVAMIYGAYFASMRIEARGNVNWPHPNSRSGWFRQTLRYCAGSCIRTSCSTH